MDFDGLLGNEQLKNRLSAMLRQEKFPHCVLISGPDGSGKHTLARLLCAALECEGGTSVPCGVCPQCRKVLHAQHPDIVTVDDPERKYLPVELIRSTCADVFIRPNEGKRKIYVFPYADKLAPAGQPPRSQNTLLKILEEPPAYATFLLLTPNPSLLLPTVRSRCAELHLQPLPQQVLLPALRERCPGRSDAEYRQAAQVGYLGAAMAALEAIAPETTAFLTAFAARDTLSMLSVLLPMEKWKRDQLLPVLQEWQSLLTDALRARYGAPCRSEALQTIRNNRTAKEILQAIEHLRTAERYCGANVSIGAVCSALAVNLSQ